MKNILSWLDRYFGIKDDPAVVAERRAEEVAEGIFQSALGVEFTLTSRK